MKIKENFTFYPRFLYLTATLLCNMPFNIRKCSKIANTFLFLFSNKMLVFRAGIYKMLVCISNRDDTDQTASSEAV